MPHGEPDALPAPPQHAETARAGEAAGATAPAAAPDLRALASGAGNAAMLERASKQRKVRYGKS